MQAQATKSLNGATMSSQSQIEVNGGDKSNYKSSKHERLQDDSRLAIQKLQTRRTQRLQSMMTKPNNEECLRVNTSFTNVNDTETNEQSVQSRTNGSRV